MNLTELARTLEVAQRARRLQAHSRPWQPTMTPATSLGYACERRSVYQRVHPDQAASIGDELASIFEEGNLHQTDVRAELTRLGYEVVESEVNFKDARLEITGTIDGKIAVPSPDGGRPRRIPVEIKSTSGDAPGSAEAWRTAENALLRRYYAQLQIYLYLTSEPEGLGIFKSKITGLWSIVAITLDYQYVEGLLRRAERIRDAVKTVRVGGDEQLPARLADRSECQGCPFMDTLCHPAEAPVDPLLLAEDDKLLEQLVEREKCNPEATRFDKIDKAVKARFKLTHGERFVVGGSDGFLDTKKVLTKQTRIAITRLGAKAEQ